MAVLDADFAFLVKSAQRFIGLLTDESIPAPRPNHRGSALADHVAATAGGVLARLREADADFKKARDDADRLEAIKKARLLAGYAHFMQRALPWFEDAAQPPLELGALYFIDEMARSIIGEQVDAVPTRTDEYSTEMWPFRPLFPALKLSLGTGPLPIVLNLPGVESHSFLLLPIFGHELGHTAALKHRLVERALAGPRSDSTFNQRINDARDELAATQRISQARARLIVDERLENWTEELLCDQLGLQYLGPTFLLALSTYLIALGWNQPGPLHPPTTTRVAHALKWLDEADWGEVLEDGMPNTVAWLRAAAATPRPATLARVLELLLDAIEDMRPEIARVTTEQLGDAVYARSDWEDVADLVMELLEQEILPAQHPDSGQPFDRRAIMLAGWLSIFKQVRRDAPTSLCLALERYDSSEFFTKALEMSYVLATWGEL